MYPLKSTMDYTNNSYSLFPKTQPIELRNKAQNYNSPLQSATANKSSSSPDSVSPEFYFEIPFYRQPDSFLSRNTCETPKPKFFGSSTSISEPKNTFEKPQNVFNTPSMSPKSIYGSPNLATSPSNFFDRHNIYEPKTYGPTFDSLLDVPNYHSNTETPCPIRRQRPIVGRKILGNSQQIQKNEKELDLWQFDALPKTPERSQKNYELFPTEKIRDFQPVNQNYDASSVTSHSYIQNPYNPGPQLQNSQYSSSIDSIGTQKMCTFCRKNGETPVVYMTHFVKEKIGNRHVVTCPILRSHKCSTCGVSGDDAHTITYCPVLRRSNNGKPLQSTTITLKNTRIKSNGRRRY